MIKIFPGRKVNEIIFTAFIAIFLISSLSACSIFKKNSSDSSFATIEEFTDKGPKKEYILQSGDILDIKFFYMPELNEKVTIRPDGLISLLLIDDIHAEGLTSPELKTKLYGKYSSVLKKPDLNVIVRKFTGRKIYVGGEVSRPGMIEIDGRISVIQSIMQAGGFKDTAQPKSVILIRDSGGEKPVVAKVNLKEYLSNPEKQDIRLKPYDVVYVPKSTIARMDQFMSQYVDKLIPVSKMFGFSYMYNLNPELNVQ